MNLLISLLGNPLMWALLGAAAAVSLWMLIRRMKRMHRQSRLLGTQLRDIGEFAVEEARCTLVSCTKEPHRFFGRELLWMRERVIYAVDVVVKIGFDFDHIDVRVENLRRRILIKLPEMRVLSATVDYESMNVFDEKTGMFSSRRLEWHRDAMRDLLALAEERVRGYGAFERAEASAKTRLEAFVAKLYDLTEYDLRIIPAGGEQEDAAEKKTSACA